MTGGGRSAILDAVAESVTTYRAYTLAAIAGIVIGSLTLVALLGIPVDFTPQALFKTFEEQQDIDERFAEHFGSTENVAMVIVRAPDVLELGIVQWMHQLGEELEEQEYADRVESITLSAIPRAGPTGADGLVGELLVDSPIDGPDVDAQELAELRSALDGSTLFDGVLIGEGRTVAIVAVILADGHDALAELEPAVIDMRSRIADADLPGGATAEMGGLANIRVYMVERFRRDQGVLIPISMLVCSICLFIAFLWLPATILPSIGVLLAGTLVMAGMALTREPFNIINQVVPTLMIVIGISDAIHLVSRYVEEIGAGDERADAARRTVRTMAAACFLTSFTTAIGFGSLIVSQTQILARFGVTAALGVMAAYVVTIFFLPSVLTFFRLPERARRTTEKRVGPIERFAVGVVRLSIARPWVTLVLGGGATVGLGVLAAGVVIDTTLLESFPPSDPVYEQTLMLQDELEGILPVEVSLSSELSGRFNDPEILNGLTRVQEAVSTEPCVLGTRTYGDLLREAWAAYTDDPAKLSEDFRSVGQVAQLASLLESGIPNPIDPYVTPNRRFLRLNIKVADCGSREALNLAERLQVHLERELAGIEDVTIELSGDAYSGSLGLDSLIRDMFNSLALAFVFIFALLSLLFRSFRIGLISIPANATPLIATMAYMAVMGINLNTTTVIIFSVSIGLAVDDTIHMLARFREERALEPDPSRALLRTAAGSGKAIVVTSFMLGSGMLVMLVSSFMPVRLFGELVCVTLVGCLLGDLIILPAMLVLFAESRRPDAAPDAPVGTPS